MVSWFTKRKSHPVTFRQRQACLEAQTLKGQLALKENDYTIASRLLQGVHSEAGWWFEQTDPSPRLVAMYAGSASLYASALWYRGYYAKSFDVIDRCRQSLIKACSQSVLLCRKRFYYHCIDALNQTLEECNCLGEQAS